MTMTTQSDHAISIHVLPSVTISHILSYLPWEDKLHAVIAVPRWKDSLLSVSAWHSVVYGNESFENMYFVKEKRTKFLICVKQYGKYMRQIQLSFGYKISHLAVKILQVISEFCTNLRTFTVTQETPVTVDSGLVWKKTTINALCSILNNCQWLKSVSLNQPVIDWSECPNSNIITNLVERGLAEKIVHLELTSESLWEHDGYFHMLTEFHNLKSLVIRREKINDDILMTLVKHSLEEVTLVQEEEIPLNQQEHLKEHFWVEILKIQPSFKIDLILRYIMVIKDSFAAKMPLRKLIMDDLVNIVTKGVVEHLIQNYQASLENFTYTNSLLENFETGDARVPFSLVNLAERCTNIKVIQFGFPLSSTTILLIAKAKKLEKFLIPAVEVSYEFDWKPSPNWSQDFIAWLKENGKSQNTLEKEVSRLQGYKWSLSFDTFSLDKKLSALCV